MLVIGIAPYSKRIIETDRLHIVIKTQKIKSNILVSTLPLTLVGLNVKVALVVVCLYAIFCENLGC